MRIETTAAWRRDAGPLISFEPSLFEPTGRAGGPSRPIDAVRGAGRRTRTLLRAVREELERFQGRQLSYMELARYAGRAASTVFDQLEREDHPVLQTLLGWLERLPEAARERLMRDACRCYPHLNHACLIHDPGQVALLRGLLQQTEGVSLISGNNDRVRTFLLSAIGHELTEHSPTAVPVSGLDLHEPDWFVGVDSVQYLPSSCPRQTVLDRWASLSRSPGRCILVNRIVTKLPEIRYELIALASERHVVLADEPGVFSGFHRLLIASGDQRGIHVKLKPQPPVLDASR